MLHTVSQPRESCITSAKGMSARRELQMPITTPKVMGNNSMKAVVVIIQLFNGDLVCCCNTVLCIFFKPRVFYRPPGDSSTIALANYHFFEFVYKPGAWWSKKILFESAQWFCLPVIVYHHSHKHHNGNQDAPCSYNLVWVMPYVHYVSI